MERLPEEKIDLLLPALNELARCVVLNVEINDEVLTNILSNILFKSEDWAIEELNIWADVFSRAHDSAKTVKVEDLQNELLNRGIPEFTAVLALESVLTNTAPAKLDSPKPGGPYVSEELGELGAKYHFASTETSPSISTNVNDQVIPEPSSIDFGVLKLGESLIRAIYVKGGPITLKQTSKHFKATRAYEGNNLTMIKIQLFSGNPGEILDDRLILGTKGGDVVIPIKAQWLKNIPIEPPLLSWCPNCKKPIGKKSLFYNKYDVRFECFACKREYPHDSQEVAKANR